MTKVYNLKVKSDIKNLKVIGNFIEEVLKKENINKDIIDEILISADEAATNIIMHSYKKRPDEIIKLKLSVEDDKIILSFFDTGETFDPSKVKTPEFVKDITKREMGGLGIFLMKKFMDEVTYYFKNTDSRKENEVRMIKYIKK
jgi:sigma-B regulation protein RsbU (phosphoserine phosphatase)